MKRPHPLAGAADPPFHTNAHLEAHHEALRRALPAVEHARKLEADVDVV
jgi:hypothetical protein